MSRLGLPVALLAAAATVAATTIDDLAPPDREGLARAVASARGVYVDAARADVIASNTVLLVSFNKAYVRFFENWACHARRLGLKYVAWPNEASAHEAAARSHACHEGHPHCHLLFTPSLSDEQHIDQVPSEFRTPNFNLITKFSIVSVLDTLRRGTNVWWSDVDIAFVRDPWPAMAAQAAACDYVFQLEAADGDSRFKGGRTGENVGFTFFRDSPHVRGFLEGAIESARDDPKMSNQPLFWKSLNARGYDVATDLDVVDAKENPPGKERFRICPLSHYKFPNGRYTSEQWLRDHASLIYHANYLKGATAKHARLVEYGLWVTVAQNEDHGKCRRFDAARFDA